MIYELMKTQKKMFCYSKKNVVLSKKASLRVIILYNGCFVIFVGKILGIPLLNNKIQYC